MKKSIAIALIFVLFLACKKKDSSTIPFTAPDSFSEVNLCNPNNFYDINVFDKLFAIRSEYEFETTQNGGLTWESKILPGEYSPFGSYIISKDTFYVYNNNLFLTTDGGNTFEILDSSSITHDLVFLSPTVGVKRGQGLYRTTDGGRTWLQTYEPDGLTYANDFQFTSNLVGYASVGFYVDQTAIGEIVKTTDGGISWQVILPNIGKGIWDISFVNNQVGYYTNTDGELLKTEDGGANWAVISNIYNDLGAFYDRIVFVTKTEGYVWNGSEGKVYLTRDSGITWSLVVNSSCDRIQNVQRVGNTVFITGKNGLILRSN